MVLRIGHRGASGQYPENTLSAFRAAMEQGANGIEFDVHRTIDGELVVMHDPTVERTTNGSGFIMGMTLAEIQRLDAGSWKGAQFAGEKVPTLREVIRETGPNCLLFCELKAGSHYYPGIEEDLLALIESERAADRIQISSFDHKALKRIHELSPSTPLGMLFSENLLDPFTMAKACGASALHPTFEWVTSSLVNDAHAEGFTVNCWVVDAPPLIEWIRATGVDGIMSNYPERLQ